MIDFAALYRQVYSQNNLFGVDRKMTSSPFAGSAVQKSGHRVNSIAVIGGALGDEGKGRVSDELTAMFLATHKHVVHYRDNGGANAGHTVEVGDVKIALHQLGAGILQKGCTVIVGKEMVVHPEDLILEIEQVLAVIPTKNTKKKLPATLLIDEMAFLCLDTHRAMEAALKQRSDGNKGATGRGIAPAYADILYRHPLRMRDLMSRNWEEKVKQHYQLYRDLIKGLGEDLKSMPAPRLDGSTVKIGTAAAMTARLAAARRYLKPFVTDVTPHLSKAWNSATPMVFEKAQALGLDRRWGVYPDVTASDCSFEGIHSSTEGLVDPAHLAIRAATIKATYTSSVGTRKLPTMMTGKLATRIREDAHEYGATTKRPRDIAYLDLPMLSYLFKVGRVDYLTITHLDISYPDVPIKVCVGYTRQGKKVDYRPDQDYLNKVKPVYVDLPAWDGAAAAQARTIKELPHKALQYLAFITQALEAKLLLGTTGPRREQTITWF